LSGLVYRHQRVQRLRRLVGRRSARKDEGRFVLEGVNLLEEALGSGAPIEAVYVDSEWGRAANEAKSRAGAGPTERRPGGGDQDAGTQGRLSALLDRCFEIGARVFELEPGVIARVADTVTPQPVMAIVEIPKCELSDVSAGGPRLLVICVDVRDPGNAGTVVRSAWAAGADGVVFCEGAVDPWNPKAVRSSAGAVLRVPIVTAGPGPAVIQEIHGWGLHTLGAVRDGGTDYASLDLTVPTALVLGNEAAGLPVDELRAVVDGWVSIPMTGGAESLNVGMAAAVLCFEAARQRRFGPPGLTAVRAAGPERGAAPDPGDPDQGDPERGDPE
jgi:RNA methyltransferase, TrmH family